MLMLEYLFFFVESLIVDKIFPACPVGRGREGRDVRVLEEMTNKGKSLNPPFRNPKVKQIVFNIILKLLKKTMNQKLY